MHPLPSPHRGPSNFGFILSKVNMNNSNST
jgi:hypothetical protein